MNSLLVSGNFFGVSFCNKIFSHAVQGKIDPLTCLPGDTSKIFIQSRKIKDSRSRLFRNLSPYSSQFHPQKVAQNKQSQVETLHPMPSLATRQFLKRNTEDLYIFTEMISRNFGTAILSIAFLVIAYSSPSEVYAKSQPESAGLICQVAASPDTGSDLAAQLRAGKTVGSPSGGVMMSGMSMKDFDVERYVGRWYEVMSIKKGFAGQGQGDCHCTQGIYTFNKEAVEVEVDTFCVHGSPSGYITGIRGKVSCVSDAELEKTQTKLERQQMIQEKCFLRFPSIPFVPKSVYNVIATDYDNFAIVSGSKGLGFVQVYSRVPNPGDKFLELQKGKLISLGYSESDIKPTPQDCPVIPMDKLEKMMSPPKMQDAMDNILPGRLVAEDNQTELEKVIEGANKKTSLFQSIAKNFFGL